MSVTLKQKFLDGLPNEVTQHPKASNDVLVLFVAMDTFRQILPDATGSEGADFIGAFGAMAGWSFEHTLEVADAVVAIAKDLVNVELTYPTQTLRATQAGGEA